jgi:hypothetical protein
MWRIWANACRRKLNLMNTMELVECEKVAERTGKLLAAVNLINCFMKAGPQVQVLKACGLSTAQKLRLHTVDIADADKWNGALGTYAPLCMVHSIPAQNVTKTQ